MHEKKKKLWHDNKLFCQGKGTYVQFSKFKAKNEEIMIHP